MIVLCYVKCMLEITEDKFKEEKGKAIVFYSGIKKIKCPYLKAEVNFNSEGFEHLLLKSWNRARSMKEQYTRLRLLPKVVNIIKVVTTLQEYEERMMFVRQKINSRWEKRAKCVFYYVFVALMKSQGIKFKIVIKQIDGGQPYFWSIYPSWKVEKVNGAGGKRVFYTGDLETI